DRQRTGGGVDEERDIPDRVAPVQEEVALDEGIRGLHLVGEGCHWTGSGEGGWPGHCDRASLACGSFANRAPIEIIDRPSARRTGLTSGRLRRARACSAASAISRSRRSCASSNTTLFICIIWPHLPSHPLIHRLRFVVGSGPRSRTFQVRSVRSSPPPCAATG